MSRASPEDHIVRPEPPPPESPPEVAPVRKVLMVAHALNLAGAAVQMRTLGEALIARGVKVAIVAGDTNPGTTRGLEWFEQAGFEVFQIPFPEYKVSVRSLMRIPGSVSAFARLLRHYQPDLVHIHAPTLCLVTHWPCRRHHVPSVTTFHISPDGKNKQRFALWSNRFLTDPLGDRVIAISSEMRETLRQDFGVPADHIRLINHGADPHYFRPPSSGERQQARQVFKVPDQQLVVAMPAILDPRKNHQLLIEALAILKKRGLLVSAICAGEGAQEYVNQLRNETERSSVSELCRFVGHQESRKVYWASDVCLLPSYAEGFGLTIIEAMLAGLPAIRTPAAGTQDQIRDGENGFVIPFDNPQILADHLAQLSENRAFLKQLGDNALTYARKYFTLDRMVDQTVDVYREVIDAYSDAEKTG